MLLGSAPINVNVLHSRHRRTPITCRYANFESRPCVARVYDPICSIVDCVILEQHRRAVAANLEGRVLDLGTGTGRMFDVYMGVESEIELHALEPDPAMRVQAKRRAQEMGLACHLIAAIGEQLPYRDDRFDAIVSSMVLCTVTDPEETISELARVLKPGGEFRMLEHVRASGCGGQVQDYITPLWRRVAGGCHPNRETDRLVDESMFDPISVSRKRILLPPVRPFVVGRYRLPVDYRR